MEVTAEEIRDAYQANGVAADQKYKGKAVQIEGVPQEIGTDADGKPHIFLHGGFVCQFDENRKGELAKLPKGQVIGVRGIFRANRDLLGMIMEKCELVEAKPVSLELSASQLYRELLAGQELANARYAGKMLKITGKVATFLGNMVVLEGPDRSCTLVCHIQDTDFERVEKLSQGQTITVHGIYRADSTAIYQCKLVK